MPRHTTVAVGEAPIELTDANVVSITFQNAGGYEVYVRAAVNSDPAPTGGDLTGWLKYAPGQGERNALLDDLFPGLAGVNRLWAKTTGGKVPVIVSHA
jgi:hypothetical protein